MKGCFVFCISFLLKAGLADISITTIGQEVVKGSTATVSCNIAGLTAEVTKIVWIKNGTDVTTLTDGTTYTPDTGGGSYDNNTGTQTSTLTVSGSDQDRLKFSCNVTDPSDGSTTGSGSVLLWFYGVTSTPKPITTFADQTLTCNITGLVIINPVTVTWVDPDGLTIQDDDTTNYSLDPGFVQLYGYQEAELTIKQVKLAKLADQSSVTYKCSAKSKGFPSSPASPYTDVIANFVVCTEDRQCTSGTCNESYLCECDGTAGKKLNETNPNICENACTEEFIYCLHNGSCAINEMTKEHECECQKGTEGYKCADFTSDPCTENPCKNGGKCSRDMSDPTDFTKRVCNCTSGFSGVDCEEGGRDDEKGGDDDDDDNRKGVEVAVLVGVIVGGTVVLLGAAVLVLVFIKRSTGKVVLTTRTVEIKFDGRSEGIVHTNPTSN